MEEYWQFPKNMMGQSLRDFLKLCGYTLESNGARYCNIICQRKINESDLIFTFFKQIFGQEYSNQIKYRAKFSTISNYFIAFGYKITKKLKLHYNTNLIQRETI